MDKKLISCFSMNENDDRGDNNAIINGSAQNHKNQGLAIQIICFLKILCFQIDNCLFLLRKLNFNRKKKNGLGCQGCVFEERLVETVSDVCICI
jgi:hypothetical protein